MNKMPQDFVEMVDCAMGYIAEGMYDGFRHFCDYVGYEYKVTVYGDAEELTEEELEKINTKAEEDLQVLWETAERLYIKEMLTVKGKTYAERKADAREKAIDWQNYASGRDMSYGELAIWHEHFEKVGKRFGLLAEFRENCIC